MLGDLSDIVVSLLHPQPSKPKSRLTSSAWNGSCFERSLGWAWTVSIGHPHVITTFYLNEIEIKKRKTIPCFFGRSTVNLWSTSRVLPWVVQQYSHLQNLQQPDTVTIETSVTIIRNTLGNTWSVPKSAPLPSITMKPNLLSSASSAVRASG